jgi:hypothetical protein
VALATKTRCRVASHCTAAAYAALGASLTRMSAHHRSLLIPNERSQQTSPGAVVRFPSTTCTGASGGPRSGMGLRPTPGSERSPGNRYPVTSAPKAQWAGGRGPDRSAVGCSILTPTPQPTAKQARRRDGIPAPHRCPASRSSPPVRLPLQPDVPPVCPFSRSPRVNHGHSCHLPPSTRRSNYRSSGT